MQWIRAFGINQLSLVTLLDASGKEVFRAVEPAAEQVAKEGRRRRAFARCSPERGPRMTHMQAREVQASVEVDQVYGSKSTLDLSSFLYTVS